MVDYRCGRCLIGHMNPAAVAGAIFFNNVGVLEMCGHGTIGLAVALLYLNRIEVGSHLLETSAGNVDFHLQECGRVTVKNVPSYRLRSDVIIEVPGEGRVMGDIAWGGNWFFLTDKHNEHIHLENISRLTEFATKIKHQLHYDGITGADGAPVDHIELFGPGDEGTDSRNFVLCPGGAYDRSPCGTGTSAKVACLMADGQLQPGQYWRQQSILGGVFVATGMWLGNSVLPEITGQAFVNAEATLLFDPTDPFCMGIRHLG